MASTDIVTVEATEFCGMPAWRLNSRSGATAIVAERGATLISWEPQPGKNIIAGYETAEELQESTSSRSRILAPWAGRIADNTYSFAGKDYNVSDTDLEGMHGVVGDKDFIATSAGATLTLSYSFEGSKGYPWPFDIAVNYSLDSGADGEEHLSVTMWATNTSEEDAPLALGWHPYVQLPGIATVSNLSLTIPARTKILKDAQRIPLAGEAAYAGVKAPLVVEYLGSQQIDSSFRGLVPDEDGVVTTVVRDPASNAQIALTQEPGEAPAIHVFTADGLPRGARESLALEPMSHLPNAFNRSDAAGSLTLSAGETRQMTATLTYR